MSDLADAVIDLGRLAMAFGGIDRTACYHPDQVTRESDSDHTVMLGWVAPALAQRWYNGQLDVGLVAQFALIHDLAEVYAGDTPTLRIEPGSPKVAFRDELLAIAELIERHREEFDAILGSLGDTISLSDARKQRRRRRA